MNWIRVDDDKDDCCSEFMAKVPGGWIVRRVRYRQVENERTGDWYSEAVSESMVFVPGEVAPNESR